LSNHAKGKLLRFVNKSLKNNLHSQFLDTVTWRLSNLQVTKPGGCATSGYFKLEVAQPPGYDIRKLGNLWVLLPTPKSLRKKPVLVNISTKTKYFLKIFWGVTDVLLIQEKNQSSIISCYCSFM